MSWKRGLLAGLVAGLLVGRMLAPPQAPAQQDVLDWSTWKTGFFEPVGLAVRRIQVNYVDEVDRKKLLAGACYGMLSQLDDYSAYIPAERLEEFEGDTRGEFGGLGIQITFDDIQKVLKVEQPIPGTPAFEAGVFAGDIITRIREVSTGKEYDPAKFEDVHDAVRVLRGKPGASVAIQVLHENSREPQEITIKRAIITIPGVRGARILDEENKIGYAYVPSFHERAAADLKKAILGLQAQGMKAFILDLRFNPGGLLTSAIDVSDLFLPECKVVSTRGRASPEQKAYSGPEDVLNGAPLVILVNRFSASASEIVAGAIKDNRRGLIIGETSFGKGSVQTIVEMKNDNEENPSALKLTTARYYTPSDICIEKAGIKPHIEIKLDDEDIRQLTQSLMSENSYPPKLPQKPQDQSAAPKSPGGAKPQGNAETKEAKKEGEKPPFHDVQLERAVDVLKALVIEAEQKAPPAAKIPPAAAPAAAPAPALPAK